MTALRFAITVLLSLAYYFLAGDLRDQSLLVKGLGATALIIAIRVGNGASPWPDPMHWTDADIKSYVRMDVLQDAIVMTAWASIAMSSPPPPWWSAPAFLGIALVLLSLVGGLTSNRKTLTRKRDEAIRSSSRVFE